MSVRIAGVSRRFSGQAALDDVSLEVATGEFAALLGPSGSGKTTLLRVLAGLDFPDDGRIEIAGTDMARVPARERQVGVVFQHYALFRHMSVAENVAFGLKVRPRARRPDSAEINRRVRELLELVQIPELAARFPDQCSGGQRQRIALARALAIEPRLLLLDEPFAALDAVVRKEVRRWVRGLHDRLGITTILVTHDQEEALELADRVAVLERGRLAQFAAPATLLAEPATAFVAGFIGEACAIPARILHGRLDSPIPGLSTPAGWHDGAVRLFLRPHELLAEAGDGPALVRMIHPSLGAATRVVLELDGHTLEATVPPGAAVPERGGRAAIRASGAIAFAEDGMRARLVAGNLPAHASAP
ncbi:ATP-binding cassette domain-containing protein [Rhodovarius crocodyli]|uniref:ATP-binding cassette domain-containing protein n=1 Tax=Rhodovarius crocodyli TaxID=1979269 RepID=A0A437MIE9_9PROT|nr:ATP-binding cassette domain-containing protein [Rhodovarius crocodyli]RVT97412.1 ATP-binding cassette domain-containing protein [Rhodovarius crocodyli]